jgi:hypothetical protein
MPTYGHFGRPIRLLEAYIDWRDERLELAESDSKADFPEFLFGPIRRSLYQGYSRVQPQYRRYARIESAQDFRETRIVGLNSLTGIGYVGDHGEYPEMRRTERVGAGVVVDTYGGVYSITRQLIRNDDTNELLNRIPEDMGRAAGRFVVDALVAIIENPGNAPDGAAFFSSGRGNQGTAALSEDALATAISAMEQQLDFDGYPIVVTPTTLIVQSPRMQLTANRIINSQLTGTAVNWTGAAGVGADVMDKGNLNPLNGILPNDGVIREPYFHDANDWYLFADPNDVPAFALAFLDGQEAPFVGLKNPVVRNALGPGEDPYEFDIDTIDYKVRLDFGAANVDPKGAYRSVVA